MSTGDPAGPATEPNPEDDKLLTLARATRARTGAAAGAAVRDTIGRTYTAAAVALPSLTISALRLAVAMAASSGAEGLEAAVVLADGGESAGRSAGGDLEADLAAVRDLGGPGVPVLLADADGRVVARAAS